MHATEPKEGKIELIADSDGLLLIDLERLRAINALGDMMIATRPSGFMVKRVTSCAVQGSYRSS